MYKCRLCLTLDDYKRAEFYTKDVELAELPQIGQIIGRASVDGWPIYLEDLQRWHVPQCLSIRGMKTYEIERLVNSLLNDGWVLSSAFFDLE